MNILRHFRTSLQCSACKHWRFKKGYNWSSWLCPQCSSFN